jgi:asparagine synthase (glutamine-hydrolysing)
MIRFAALAAVPSWFVVLADCDSARPLAPALRDQATHQISHPSGRPWLLGCWTDGTVTTGQAGQTKIALIGQHTVTADQLAEAAGRIGTVADLDRLAASLVGSSHLVASVAGRVRVQGTVTGVRRVFHAAIGDTTVAADRADLLAGLLDTGLDEQRLALHLLEPHILYPLAGEPVWQGVPVMPMAEGALALREALSAAVAARARARNLISCDLGGVDSTSVCCLAARGEAKVVAYTAASPDPLADDVEWAARTVSGLGNIEHHIIPAEEIPLVYHGLLDTDDQLDEPFSAAVDRDRWLIIARRAAARGSELHLTGFGGDELLYGSVAHLHGLLRTNPRIAVRQLRGFAAKYRWPRGRLLRQLSDTSPYRDWLARVADTVTAPPPPPEEPLLDWGFRPRLPPWVTPAAAQAVQELIRAEAPTAEPLAPGRGQQRELEGMRHVSRTVRQFGQMAERVGVALASPYYDDRVIEAGLAVRPQERITPWRYKPLLVEAMRGIVPNESLTRQTKANGTGAEDPGLRRHRADLLTLWEDSRLGRLGLIDAHALRELCTRPLPPQLQLGVLYQTVACEVWLRSLEPATVPS